MVRLNFRKSPPHARNTSKTHSEAVDFAGALGVTSNGGPTDRPRHSPYGRDAARVFLGSGSSLSASLFVQLASTAWQPEGSKTHQPTRPL
jgi:hypothetical protein